ncbi:MAG: hypothetical protein JWM19_7508 [Actinomycetia bacterium]|nr:hypothetical protein [Actinomycetes bacterium]
MMTELRVRVNGHGHATRPGYSACVQAHVAKALGQLLPGALDTGGR